MLTDHCSGKHTLSACKVMSLCAAFMLLSCLTPSVKAKPGNQLPVQYWGLSAWPGLVNSQEDRVTDGLMVELLHEITRQLPQYRNTPILMNQSRAFADLQHNDNLCMVGALNNTQRSQQTYFVGLFIISPPQLVFRREDRLRIADSRNIQSLQELLKRKDLRGAVQKGRIYGDQLDPLLASAISEQRVQQINSSDMGENLVHMLQARRIDFILEYPEKLLLASSPDMQTTQLDTLPLLETTAPSIAGIHCPRTAHGRDLILRIDAIARQPEVLQFYQEHLRAFIAPSQRAQYGPWIDDFFRNRSQQPLTNVDWHQPEPTSEVQTPALNSR